MSLEASGPNAEMIAYWNEQSGAKWVALEAVLDAQISPVGLAAMDRAGIAAGERVLDVGCGCGQTSLQLAERVGPTGSVLGIDLSSPMLERARERAGELGLANLHFEQRDAQTADFDASFDVLFSRFGVMFFADPPGAFANLRSALRDGGRLAFVCWQGLDRNPWMRVPLMAAAPHIELPAPPKPGAPGPFAFGDPERVHGILDAAGFRDVACESLERELLIGGGGPLDRAVDFILQMGPAGAALRQAPPENLATVRDAVHAALAPHHTSDGVRMSSASWLVTAAN